MFKERKSRLKFGSGSEVSSTMNTSSSNKKRALSKLSFADDNEKEEAITEEALSMKRTNFKKMRQAPQISISSMEAAQEAEEGPEIDKYSADTIASLRQSQQHAYHRKQKQQQINSSVTQHQEDFLGNVEAGMQLEGAAAERAMQQLGGDVGEGAEALEFDDIIDGDHKAHSGLNSPVKVEVIGISRATAQSRVCSREPVSLAEVLTYVEGSKGSQDERLQQIDVRLTSLLGQLDNAEEESKFRKKALKPMVEQLNAVMALFSFSEELVIFLRTKLESVNQLVRSSLQSLEQCMVALSKKRVECAEDSVLKLLVTWNEPGAKSEPKPGYSPLSTKTTLSLRWSSAVSTSSDANTGSETFTAKYQPVAGSLFGEDDGSDEVDEFGRSISMRVVRNCDLDVLAARQRDRGPRKAAQGLVLKSRRDVYEKYEYLDESDTDLLDTRRRSSSVLIQAADALMEGASERLSSVNGILQEMTEIRCACYEATLNTGENNGKMDRMRAVSQVQAVSRVQDSRSYYEKLYVSLSLSDLLSPVIQFELTRTVLAAGTSDDKYGHLMAFDPSLFKESSWYRSISSYAAADPHRDSTDFASDDSDDSDDSTDATLLARVVAKVYVPWLMDIMMHAFDPIIAEQSRALATRVRELLELSAKDSTLMKCTAEIRTSLRDATCGSLQRGILEIFAKHLLGKHGYLSFLPSIYITQEAAEPSGDRPLFAQIDTCAESCCEAFGSRPLDMQYCAHLSQETVSNFVDVICSRYSLLCVVLSNLGRFREFDEGHAHNTLRVDGIVLDVINSDALKFCTRALLGMALCVFAKDSVGSDAGGNLLIRSISEALAVTQNLYIIARSLTGDGEDICPDCRGASVETVEETWMRVKNFG